MIVESLMFEAGTSGSICKVENLTQGIHVIRGPQASGKSNAHALAALTLFGQDDRDRRHNSGAQEQAHYLLTDCDMQPGVEPGQPVALHAKAFDRHQLAALRRWYAPDFTCEDPRQALREHLDLVTAQLEQWQQQPHCAQQVGQAAARGTAAQVLAEIELEIRRLEDPTSCDLCRCRQFPARLRPLLQSLHQCLDESAAAPDGYDQDADALLLRQLSDETQHLKVLRQQRDELADRQAYAVETESADDDIWQRASEFLARMSVGDLTQIAPADVPDSFRFCDGSGRWISLDALSVDACDMVRLSLTLAVADRHHRDGVQLPLLLDEPSRNLDERYRTALLSLLERSAHDGRQIVILMADEVPIHELLERGFTVHQIGRQDHRYCPHCGTSDEAHVTLTSEHWWNLQSYDLDVNDEADSADGCARDSAGYFEAGDPQSESRADEVEWSDEQYANDSLVRESASSTFDLVGRIKEVKQRNEPSDEIVELDAHRVATSHSTSHDDVDPSQTNRRTTTGSSHLMDRSGSSSNGSTRKLRQRKKRIRQRKTLRRPQRHTDPGAKPERSSRVTTSRSRNGQETRAEDSTTTESQRTGVGKVTSQRRKSIRRRDTTERHSELARDSRTSQTSVDRPEAKSQSQTTRPLRYFLKTADPVVDAPEIGPKMAEQLAKIGIHTVQDLLQADPESAAERLKHRRTNAEVVRRWQDQSRLMCQIPQIRGHDAQILVACQITQPQQLAASNPETLYAAVAPFSTSKAGARIIRGGQQPDLPEVRDWISWAQSAAKASAA